MSRGPGRWQRALIQAADGALVATTYGVVKATLAAPYRNDFTTARRGARGLALKQRLTAVCVWSCTRCLRIQDRADPEPC